MEHVVFFSETPGEPEFRRGGDLEEAVRLVERLRNDRGISDVSLHALTPVPVSFRTYYRVEVALGDPTGSGEAVSEPAPERDAEAVLPPAAAPSVAPSIALAPEPEYSLDSFASFAALPEPAPESVLTLLPPPVETDGILGLAPDDADRADDADLPFLLADEGDVPFLLADEGVALGADDEAPPAEETAERGAAAPFGVPAPPARAEADPERSLGSFPH